MSTYLNDVVTSGSGKQAYIEGYSVGGKTGTAQKYENGAIAKGKYIASFIGYYPSDKPQYIVLVLVDEPQGAYYGGIVAAPVAKEIFQSIIDVRYTEEQYNSAYIYSQKEAHIELPNLIGMTLSEAGGVLASLNLQYLISGSGNTVSSTVAAPGTMLTEGDIVLLIME